MVRNREITLPEQVVHQGRKGGPATGIAWRDHAHQASYHSRGPGAQLGRIGCGGVGNICGRRACSHHPHAGSRGHLLSRLSSLSQLRAPRLQAPPEAYRRRRCAARTNLDTEIGGMGQTPCTRPTSLSGRNRCGL